MRKTNRKKAQKGITLIALIVTIIVLIILAGVAISMLSGDSGILNRASEAKVLTEIGSFKEQVSLASLNVKTKISSEMVSNEGYTATASDNIKELAEEVARDLGITVANKIEAPVEVASANGVDGLEIAALVGKGTGINTEGYTVAYVIDTAGENGQDGHGYIIIWYTSNSLRSSIDTVNAVSKYNIANTAGENVTISRNEAVLVSVINVENYNSELATFTQTGTTTGLTSKTVGNSDISNSEFSANDKLDTKYRPLGNETSPIDPEPTTVAGYSGITIGAPIDYITSTDLKAADGTTSITWEVFYGNEEGDLYIITKEKCKSPDNTINITYEASTTSSVLKNNNNVAYSGTELESSQAVTKGLMSEMEKYLSSKPITKSQLNMQATNYMLDNGKWSGYVNPSKGADWAIGGPTLELLCMAYNKYYGYDSENTNYKWPSVSVFDGVGYNNARINSGIAADTVFDCSTNINGSKYWLASPNFNGRDYMNFAAPGDGEISMMAVYNENERFPPSSSFIWSPT